MICMIRLSKVKKNQIEESRLVKELTHVKKVRSKSNIHSVGEDKICSYKA